MGTRYVVITQHKHDSETNSFLRDVYDSEEAAHAAKREADEAHGTEWMRTVHKLGPVLTLPEPREWVVVGKTGICSSYLMTKSAAEAFVKARYEDPHARAQDDLRIMRVVPEDGAA